MKLKKYLEEKECPKKAYYSELNLLSFDGKEKHYLEILEFLLISLEKKEKRFQNKLKKLLKMLYGSSLEDEQIKDYVESLFLRLWDFLIFENATIVDAGFIFSVDPEDRLEHRCDVVIQRAGVLEGVMFSFKKPTYSYRGKKFLTKAENSLELLGLLKEMMKRYPDKEVQASFFHLRSKKDKQSELRPFNEKKGDNVVSLNLNILQKKMKTPFENYFVAISNEYLNHELEKDCSKCRYSGICSFECSQGKKNIENVLVREVVKSTDKNTIVLNNEQNAIINAILANEQQIKVSAVPGAGKTRIITEGVKTLIEKNKIDPKKILILTFTRKATDEIKGRLDGVEGVNITNYNSFGYVLVRKFYESLGYNYPPRLVTTFESFSILKDIIVEMGVSVRYEYLFHKTFGQMPEMAKAVNFAISENMMRNHILYDLEKVKYRKFKVSEEFLTLLPIIALRYQAVLREKNLISYEQQIDLVLELFRDEPHLVKKLSDKYEYVFLDEYQDTNVKQHEMIMAFAKRFVMVGDEDQSIFAFRGSNPSTFLNFSKGSQQFFLQNNYRSGARIASEANFLIQQNEMRLEKEIIPMSARKGLYKEHCVFDYSGIAGIIESILERNIAPCDIAIITRKNKHIGELKETLDKLGIPSYPSHKNMLNEPIFVLFKSFLSIVLGKATRLDEFIVFKHVYGVEDIPRWGSISSNLLLKNHQAYGWFEEDLKKVAGIEGWQYQVERIFEVIGAESREVLEYLLELSEKLYLASIDELFEVIEGFVTVGEDINMPVHGDGVKLLTAHTSKGLEFKAVLVYRPEEFKPKDTLEAEEERRLLYVAMTRAEQELHMVRQEKVHSKVAEVS